MGRVPPTAVLVLVGLLLLVAFVHWTMRRIERNESPLFSFGTFADANYRAGIATDALESLLIAGLLFIVPVFLQSGRGYTALESGVALLPFSLAILVAALGLPRLGEKVSPKVLIQVGTVLIAVGLVWYRSVSGGAFTRVDLIGPFAVIGVGIGALLSQVTNVTLSGVADEERGSATGVYNTGKELGTSLGTAIIGTAMLVSFFQFYVDTSAATIGTELTTSEARVLAIDLEDAEQRLDDGRLVELIQAEAPGLRRRGHRRHRGRLVDPSEPSRRGDGGRGRRADLRGIDVHQGAQTRAGECGTRERLGSTSTHTTWGRSMRSTVVQFSRRTIEYVICL